MSPELEELEERIRTLESEKETLTDRVSELEGVVERRDETIDELNEKLKDVARMANEIFGTADDLRRLTR